MKKSLMILTMLAAVSVLPAGCSNDNSEERVDNAQEELNEARADLREDIADFRRDMDARIDANQARIEKLREERREDKMENREVYNQRIDELQERNAEMRERMRDYDNTDDRKSWDEFKAQFNRDMDEFGNRMNEIFDGDGDMNK